MEELQQNTPSELVTQLVDGELDAARQSSVFGMLSGDQALQQEFQEQLAIRESVRNDNEAFSPPADAATAIFSAVGFSNPAPVIPAVEKSILSGLINRIWPPLAAAAAAALITFLLLNNNYENRLDQLSREVESLKGNQAVENVNAGDLGIISAPKNKIPLVSSVENESRVYHKNRVAHKNTNTNAVISNRTTTIRTNNAVANKVLVNNKENLSLKTDSPADDFLLGNSSLVISENPGSLQTASLIGQNNLPDQFILNNANYGRSASDLAGRDIYITLRGISPFALTEKNLPANNVSLSYFSAGGFVTWARDLGIIKELQVGLEVGAEPFLISYYDNNSNGYLDHVDKNVHLFWASFGCMAQFADIWPGTELKPYGQLSLGGTFIGGPLFKMGGGLQYNVYPNLGLYGGIELSSLFFKYQNNWYTAEKAGLTGGLKFKF